ncbi:MAG: hypothetical protein MJZ89_00895 [Paludibacteraceae bacterium]|nr:hypothetical protein [Paludibacteraceae bacterium]
MKNTYFYLAAAALVGVLTTACREKDEPEKEHFGTAGELTSPLPIMNDWENATKVTYAQGNTMREVFVPWSDQLAESSHIPANITEDMTSENGWELQFSGFDNDQAKDLPYFVFYNRLTGIMRVMYFVSPELQLTAANDVMFTIGAAADVNAKHAAAHMMTYAVPNKQVEEAMPSYLIGGEKMTSFSTYISPYDVKPNREEPITLENGWWAYDVDMSAYNPGTNNRFFPSITLSSRGKVTHSLDVYGAISANLVGDLSRTEHIEAYSASGGGISDYFSYGKKFYDDYLSNIIAAVKNPKDVMKFVNLIQNAVRDVNAASKGEIVEAPGYDQKILIGDINTTITGDIRLSGLLSGNAATGIATLQMTSRNSNPDGHLGEGIWGLEEAPVVYVVKDALLWSGPVNMTRTQAGTYNCASLEQAMPYLMTYLDPSSIVLNLNPELGAKAEDITLSAYTCVYPYEKLGHTRAFGQTFGQNIESDLVVTKNSSYKTRFPKEGEMKAYMVSPEDLQLMGGQETGSTYQYDIVSANDTLKGASISYFGCSGDATLKNVIMDPMVSLPYKKMDETGASYIVTDPVLPDFVVVVTVSFVADGHTFIFSKRFLPDVKQITMADLQKNRNKLEQLSEGTAKGATNIAGKTYDYAHSANAVKRVLQFLRLIGQ